MLEIGRIRFRPFRREDLHLLECWENFHKGTLYARGRSMEFKNFDELEMDYQKYLDNPKKQIYLVEICTDDKAIGYATHEDSGKEVKSASIGAYIGESEYWNMGIGKEMTLGLCEMLFFHRNHDRLSAWTSSVNHRSQRVLKELGFKHSGTARKSGYIMGKRVDWLMYDLLREEYIQSREGYIKKYLEDREDYLREYCTL